MGVDPQEVVDSLGDGPDSDINLGQAALALAAVDQPGISMDRYVHHLDVLKQEVSSRFLAFLEGGAPDNLETRLASLKRVISDDHAYVGDVQDYKNLENVSLIRVIDRAMGIPITLSILYIHVARELGWSVSGLNIPGHFVCRLEQDGQRIIFDPFRDCKVLQAPDLRILIKQALGDQAELSAQYFEPTPNRGILIRLLNNIKHRKIEDEDYQGALDVVERMRKIDANEFRLLLDAGVLYAKVEQPKAAIDALEAYLEKVPHNPAWHADRHDAQMLLSELRMKIN